MLIHRIYTLYVITYTAAENFFSHCHWPPKAATIPPVLPSKQVRLMIYLNVVSQCLFLFQEEKHSLGIPSG